MTSSLSVMTYNIRAGLGTDGRRSVERIAEVIENAGVDIVALQEVDDGRRRSDTKNQPQLLASMLAMEFFFGVTMDDDGGQYGNALLSRHPMKLLSNTPLPGSPGSEPRAMLTATIDVGGHRVDVGCTHFSTKSRERPAQAQAILKSPLARSDAVATILCGDFNCPPISTTSRRLQTAFRRARVDRLLPIGSWPSSLPVLPLDHVLYRGAVEPTSTAIVTTPLARTASDHLPVVTRLRFR